MPTPWRPTINPVQDGELVKAQVANRPTTQLAGQTAHLKERIENLSATSGRLVYENSPLSAETVVGDIVYFDRDNNVFKPAIAEVVQDGTTGRMVCSARAYAVGMVFAKISSTVGTILQLGRFDTSALGLDPNDMVEDPVAAPFVPGRYFLSTKIPGKITSTQVMPAIQIGFFSDTECNIQPLLKDLFESHSHHRYPLRSKPSASQNYNQTGWTSFGLSGPTDRKRVDYFNQGSSATPPAILMCIRHSANPAINEADPIRVEVYNDGGSLQIDLLSGSLNYEAPNGAATTTTALPPQSWPAYGEWVGITGTNLEIAFIRSDDTYAHTLAYDAAALLTTTAKKFKVFLPTDLGGWTNANPFDLTTPTGALYRYLLPQDDDLLAAWPPLPVSSAMIVLNGSEMEPDSDFVVNPSGIFWKVGFFSPTDYAPWPSDYSADSGVTQDPSNAKNLVFYFLKSTLDGLRSVVFSLKGVAPIKVTHCPDGNPASAGDLQVSIDLGLLINSDDPAVRETALGTVSGVKFDRAMLVSELIEGTGVRLENITPNSAFPTRKVGKVRVSLRTSKFEGEFNSIALRNAKEMIAPTGGSYIDFIIPSQGASGITAQFKVPNLDIDTDQFKLRVLGGFRGDTAVSGASAEQFGIFKATFHVLRPGFMMSAMNETNALAVQYWKIPFAPGYSATTILSPEYPYKDGDEDFFEINAQTLLDNPSSLVALDGGYKAGDRVVLLLDRVTTDDEDNVANYPGRIGLIGLRWALL